MITSLGERDSFCSRFWHCLSTVLTISCAGGGICRLGWGQLPTCSTFRGASLQLGRGMCVYTPARKAVFCAFGEPSTMPRALLASVSSFPAFQVEGAREESTLACPGSSKTAACKCSWRLFEICVCVKSSFPGVRSGGMKGGGLDACFVHCQAAPPGEHAAEAGSDPGTARSGQGSLSQGSICCIKTFFQVLSSCLPQAMPASQAPGQDAQFLASLLGRATVGAWGLLLWRSMRWLSCPGLVARSKQQSQSHTLALPLLASGFSPGLWCCCLWFASW